MDEDVVADAAAMGDAGSPDDGAGDGPDEPTADDAGQSIPDDDGGSDDQPEAAVPDPTRLRIATWNLEWLHADNDTGIRPRQDADYEALQRYAQTLDADVIALQEVQSEAAAARVFDGTGYDFAISSRASDQRTGFAYRKSLDVVRHEDFRALDFSGGGQLRYGVDISVRSGGSELRMLSIHLKSFCFEQPLDSPDSDCEKLSQQVAPLESWIDARASQGLPFAVLGDFNRRFDNDDGEMFADLSDGNPSNSVLLRVTQGRTSLCLGEIYPEYIDHILLDALSAQWLEPDSFTQVLYDAQDDDRVLSDHCPIGVDLTFGAAQ